MGIEVLVIRSKGRARAESCNTLASQDANSHFQMSPPPFLSIQTPPPRAVAPEFFSLPHHDHTDYRCCVLWRCGWFSFIS